jgi:hypothetical protein
VGCGIGGLALLRFVKQSTQVRSTPTAARAGPETVAQLAGPRRSFHAQVIQYFALGHVKAQAKLFVEFHGNPFEMLNDEY